MASDEVDDAFSIKIVFVIVKTLIISWWRWRLASAIVLPYWHWNVTALALERQSASDGTLFGLSF